MISKIKIANNFAKEFVQSTSWTKLWKINKTFLSAKINIIFSNQYCSKFLQYTTHSDRLLKWTKFIIELMYCSLSSLKYASLNLIAHSSKIATWNINKFFNWSLQEPSLIRSVSKCNFTLHASITKDHYCYITGNIIFHITV